ncbi:FAD-dependent 5-carboxymethylaminomethyl-2-thiouridine(34) oxidoreductase MnmC [Vreelandella utahensis]|uniref:FAD-dependent 5-carboxymethylaminomethyl-2-thiouridine(34) oxidoreductase MnmC n=1 Tax=Vreelandella halophila TaxID=86177 RepID=UPI000984C929|nr:FAD-dependent 5-carboxymethylaminomethyl-2-thiouridine(34) oxidoreductase MnmC [Halomonas utahensis]
MASHDATDPQRRVIIIGAGVAGSLAARRLAESGIQVTMLDPALPFPLDPERRGALYMKPAVDYNPETRLAHQAFLAAPEFYTRLQTEHPEIDFWSGTGTLSLAWNEREQQRQEKLLARNQWNPEFLEPVDSDRASLLSGLELGVPGLWFPGGGHIRVDALRQAALSHPLIRVITAVADGGRIQPDTDFWRLALPEGGTLEASTLVVATGAATNEWAPNLPLGRIRGQLTTLPATSAAPKVALAGAGYALPPFHGRVCVGATFDRDSGLGTPDAPSDRANIENLGHWLPALAGQLEENHDPGHWVGFRSTTPDHMPVAGHLNDRFVLAGLGGKGLMYAPLLAEHLTALISGSPSPLPADAAQRVSPLRFFKS